MTEVLGWTFPASISYTQSPDENAAGESSSACSLFASVTYLYFQSGNLQCFIQRSIQKFVILPGPPYKTMSLIFVVYPE